MNVTRRLSRRDVARGIAAFAAASALYCPSHAQSAARVVVIGGGFGGASCARALRRLDAKLQVTLIEPNRTFTACPFSNEVIAGLRELRDRTSRSLGLRLPELSMGMSGDYEVAIEEGSTMVRVGTSLFGSRDRMRSQGGATCS